MTSDAQEVCVKLQALLSVPKSQRWERHMDDRAGIFKSATGLPYVHSAGQVRSPSHNIVCYTILASTFSELATRSQQDLHGYSAKSVRQNLITEPRGLPLSFSWWRTRTKQGFSRIAKALCDLRIVELITYSIEQDPSHLSQLAFSVRSLRIGNLLDNTVPCPFVHSGLQYLLAPLSD